MAHILEDEPGEPPAFETAAVRGFWPRFLRKDRIFRWPKLVYLTLALSFGVLASYFIVSSSVQDEWLRLVFSDILSPVVLLLACGGLYYAVRRTAGDPALQRAWWVILAALAATTLGEVIWSIQEIVLKDPAFPSPADLFYLAFYLLMIAGVLWLPRPQLSRNEKTKSIFDMGIILLGAGLVYWNFLIGPILLTSGANTPWLSTLVSAAYPIFDLVLLWVLFGALAQLLGRYNRWPVTLLGLGVFSQVLSDSIYSFQAILDTYTSGGLLDAGWLLAYCFIGLAGVVQGLSPASDRALDDAWAGQSKLGDVQIYLPYLWLVASYFTLLWSFEHVLPMSTLEMALGAGVMIVLVLARQIITFAENIRLTRRLQIQLLKRKRIASKLKVQKEKFEKLVDVARVTTSSPSLSECLQNVMGVSVEITQAERGSLFIFDEAGEATHCILARGASIKEEMIFVQRVMEKGLAGWVYRTQQPALIPDVEQDERWLRLDSAPYEIRSVLSAPICLGKKTLGVLTLHHPQPDYFTEDQLQFLLAAAQQMALALNNAQILEEQLRLGAALKTARDAADQLLLNILPGPVAGRLKAGETVIADSFPEVSVLFADLVDFTPFAGTVAPAQLVNTLNLVFSRFDDLVEKHGVEKIKTSGDAYMVVGGLNLPGGAGGGAEGGAAGHALAVADMALEMLQVVEALKENSQMTFELRVGIHSGPVVAGVIGKKKFSYDLWGDTVNIASRMESQGVTGAIQVTQAVYDLLGEAYQCEPRGPISVKGKGDMPTYLLLGRSPNPKGWAVKNTAEGR